MRHFASLREAFDVCSAIGSPVRLELLENILEYSTVNLDTLAKNMHLTNGALTKHIAMLESAGLIDVTVKKGRRGLEKQCSIKADKLLIDITAEQTDQSGGSSRIPIGLYSDVSAAAPCGLASLKNFIGTVDEPASFLSPQRADAELIWMRKGSLSYMLPPLKKTSEIDELQLMFEISPDFLGGGKIAEGMFSFYLNGDNIGSASVSAPDNTERRGYLTPVWYDSSLPNFGTLKTLRLTKKGVYLDGDRLSGPISHGALKTFSIAAADGLVLFGPSFGDRNVGISYRELRK